MKNSPTKALPGTLLPNARAALEQRFGSLDYRPIDELKAYANNPRKHGEKQIAMLMASMSEFGFAIPVLVDVDGTIIAGEARVTAARNLGLSQVPVLVAEHWTKAQVRAYRLADNQLATTATWDQELLRIEIAHVIEIGEVSIDVLGWNTAEIDILLDEGAGEPDDQIPEPPLEPTSRPGDLWQLGAHRLLCGSSLDHENWIRLLDGEVATMAFVDGPYNVPIKGHVSGLGRHSHDNFKFASGEMDSAEAICFALTDACGRPGARLVVTVPPRHLKSVAASVALPAFLLGLDPSRRIMVATYSQDLARLHAGQCRQIMQSAWYQRLFPNTRLADDGTRSLELKTTAGGGRKAVSVGGTVTGFGADVIIVDDCLKAEDSRSQAMRDELKAWFDGTLQTRQNQAGRGVIISISQRLHEDDLPAHLFEKGYDHLCLPAIATKEERVLIGSGIWHRRGVGDVLDRPGQTRELLEAERRNLGPQVYEAQYQQNPVAPEGNLIRLEWFGTYDPAPARHDFRYVIQSWDTAQTDSPTSDYSVCATWGYFDKHYLLLDVVRQRLAYPDLKRAVEAQRIAWKADVVVIEDAGTGTSLWQEFAAQRREWRPVMWKPDRGKEERLIGVTAQLESGLCKLPSEAPWLEAFRSELRSFPYGRNDDQVDSMSQFLEYHIIRGSAWIEPRGPSGRKISINRPQRRYGGWH